MTQRPAPRRSIGRCAIIAGVIGICASHAAADTQTLQSGDWSDPAIWSTGQLPSASDAVTISSGDTVTYDLNSARVAGVTVEDGATLAFDPDRDVTLETNANVLVRGKLVMRPKPPDNDGWRNSLSEWRPYFIHTLRFVNIDERKFVGGGMDVLASDVGLWIRGDGALDIMGAAKTGWTRLAGSAHAGDTSVTLASKPTGWRTGDTIVIVPTEHPSVGSRSYNGFEVREIAFASGQTMKLSSALGHDHPEAADPNTGKIYTAEVLNLSRNVRIEGTGNGSASFQPSVNGRAHIQIKSDKPQSVRYAELVQLGPRRPHSSDPTDGVAGRYPLHFHHSGNGSRGSLVEGVVVRRSGNRAFVPHASHGITFRDTVAYDVWEDAYWWDPGDGNETNDVLWDKTVAALIKDDPSYRGFRLAGYVLHHGSNMAVRNSVAVGVQGNVDAAGFDWPEFSHGVWDFSSGNIAHNNKVDGIFVWQNDSLPHAVEDFVAYRNGEYGIEHGAYLNSYNYLDTSLFDNDDGGIQLHSLPQSGSARPDGYTLAFDGVLSNGRLKLIKHTLDGQLPVLFKDCEFSGVDVNENAKPGHYDFVSCGLEPSDFNLTSALSGMLIRVQRSNGTAYQIDRTGKVTTIPAFYATGGGGGGGDTEPPTAPSGLAPTVVSSTQVDLSWAASTDNVGVSGYRVYRDGSRIATVSGTSHSDTGLAADTAYRYEVAAIDAAGNESDRSPAAQATTLSDDPGDPGGDPGGGGSGGNAVVQWDGPQEFNGTSDFVNLGAVDVTGTAITIVVRFTADTFACPDCSSRDGRLVSKATGTQSADHYWMLSTISSGSSNRLRFRLKTNGSTSTLVAGSGNLQPGVSYHAAAVYDGTQMRLYLDGAQVGSRSESGAINTNGAVEAWIGANPNGHRWWDGMIGDVRIYDRALSASEIATLAAPAGGGGDTGDDTGGDAGDDTGGDTGDDTGGDTGDDTGGDTGGTAPVVQWDGPEGFNGTSDFVNLGAVDVTGTAITIVTRFAADTFACPDCSSRDGRLVSKATGTQSADHYWMLSTISSGSSNRLRFRLKTNGSTSTLVAGSGNLQPGVSYHAAAVYDGTQMRLYLDGAQVGSRSESGAINTNGAVEAWIGANPDGHRWWDGMIGDVRIYDRALSASEIAALAAP